MSKSRYPQIPFVEALYRGRRQKPMLIVLRLSGTSSNRGAALAIARMWFKPNSPVDSCHYVVDESTTYQCVPDNLVSMCVNYPEKGALTINVCAEPVGSLLKWEDSTHTQLFSRTSDLVAQLAHNYRIPVRYMTADDEARWLKWRRRSRGGILLKLQGEWPKYAFLADVQRKIENKKGEERRHGPRSVRTFAFSRSPR